MAWKEELLVGVAILVIGTTIASIIRDNIRGYTNFHTLKNMWRKRRTDKPSVPSGAKDNVLELQSPGVNNDCLKFNFSSGASISFSLKSVRKNFKTKEEFITHFEEANRHLVTNEHTTDYDLHQTLEYVWNKAHEVIRK